MSGLKTVEYALVQAGVKVTPDEMDMYQQYVILHPSVSQSYVGAMSGGGTNPAGTLVPTANRLDYPRNLLVAQDAGTTGGTALVTGKDQFGNPITESIGFGTAAGTQNANGTKVFAEVSAVTWTGGTTADFAGTVNIGVAIGTSTTSPVFGLPSKIGGTTDIKAITWVDNDVTKQHDAASAANTALHAFKGTVAIAAADSYVILYRPTKDLSNEGYQAGL